MGSLNNLYISQSYQSLLHFATDSGSTATLTEIEDGSGNGLGIFLNTAGDAIFEGDVAIGGDLEISGAIDIEGAIVIRDNVYVTGSIYSSQDISSSRVLTGEITASNMTIAGTLNVYEIHTTIESSSVIFSSGSNVLGDSLLDTQTLNGTIIVSGSEQVTGSLYVSNEISSSTINGIGNVTAYSASVQSYINSVSSSISGTLTTQSQSFDARLDYLEVPFSTSVDSRLDALEAATASLGYVTTGSFYAYTASVNADLTSIHQTTASLNAFTQSFSSSVAADFVTTNNNITSLSQSVSSSNAATNQRINVLSSFTGSYATTGSNTFIGTESITGSLNITGSMGIRGNMIYSGSVRGVVIPITITSQTASIDCSLGNFFTLTLASGSATNIQATNILPGETLSLRVVQPSVGYGSVTTNGGSIRFPQTSPYIATPSGSAVDVLSFLSFDTSTLYGVSVNTMR